MLLHLKSKELIFHTLISYGNVTKKQKECLFVYIICIKKELILVDNCEEYDRKT